MKQKVLFLIVGLCLCCPTLLFADFSMGTDAIPTPSLSMSLSTSTSATPSPEGSPTGTVAAKPKKPEKPVSRFCWGACGFKGEVSNTSVEQRCPRKANCACVEKGGSFGIPKYYQCEAGENSECPKKCWNIRKTTRKPQKWYCKCHTVRASNMLGGNAYIDDGRVEYLERDGEFIAFEDLEVEDQQTLQAEMHGLAQTDQCLDAALSAFADETL